MASNQSLGGETNDKTKSDEKVHIGDDDGASHCMTSLQSMPTDSGDIINSTTPIKSSDTVNEVSSSDEIIRTEPSDNRNSTETFTLTKEEGTIDDVISEDIQSTSDARDETNKEFEKGGDDFKDETEHVVGNDVRDEANAEANGKEKVHDQDQCMKISEHSKDDTKIKVTDETFVEEANEKPIDKTNNTGIDDSFVKESNDESNNEVGGEAFVELATEQSRDETGDTARDEAKADAYEEARDETKDIDNDEVRGGTKGGTSKVTMDTEKPEDREELRCDEADEASNEVADESLESDQEQNEDDSSISIDEDIWRYILKTKDWMSRIRHLKEELDIEIEESTSSDGMRLQVSGLIESSVKRADGEMRTLISECQKVVSTTEVPCHENHVHSKVVRFMKSINKLPSYVSAASELLRVTGTREEIRACLEKLATYGVRYEFEGEVEATEDSALPEEQIPPERSLDNALQQDSFTRELPVPIEKHLWHFIAEKRKSELREIEEGFGVTISTKPRNDVSTVTVSISVLSSDNSQLLDLAQQALGQLLERLGLQVVVTCVLEGEVVAKIPQELLNNLRQDLADVDVILQIIQSVGGQRPGHRLLIVGPEKEIGLNQQALNRAFEKLRNSLNPGLLNENENFGENSNVQQMFPGPGNRLGMRDSATREDHSSRIATNPGHAQPARATGGPPFQDNARANAVPMYNASTNDNARPNHAADRIPGQYNTSDRHSEPKSDKETPLKVPGASHTRAERPENDVVSSAVSQKSTEKLTEKSRPEDKTTKAKKVTFSDANDGIRVYASDTPSSSNHSKTDRQSDDDANPRSEEKEMPSSDNYKERDNPDEDDDDVSCSGRHVSPCSTCKDDSDGVKRVTGCNHVLCLACVRDYVEPAASCCPLCGNRGRPTAAATQPIGGQMLVTYNNACRLPGFENNSKGIIIITYVFKEGYQTVSHRLLVDLSKSLFLPFSNRFLISSCVC